MKAVFVSDLHLVDSDDEKTKTFVRFLQDLLLQAQGAHVGTAAAAANATLSAATSVAPVSTSAADKLTHLFLVGDIFDLWVGAHDYFAQRFQPVVTAVKALVAAGVEVHYFEGNHDLHLSKFWRDQVGASVHPDGSVFKINALTVRVEHGDMINPDDAGYLFLRKLLRSKVITALAMNLPERLVKTIGEKASLASRDYTSNAKGKPSEEIRILIRKHAERQYKQERFDLIITGHVHVVDDFAFNAADANESADRKVRSVNLGSWFDGAKAFVIDAHGERFIEVARVTS